METLCGRRAVYPHNRLGGDALVRCWNNPALLALCELRLHDGMKKFRREGRGRFFSFPTKHFVQVNNFASDLDDSKKAYQSP
jgi:hypothetical protein